jgi:hypothetical protein
MADVLAFSGTLEEKGGQLQEFNRLTDLQLSNLDREINLKGSALSASLKKYRIEVQIEQRDISNALKLQGLRNDFMMKNLSRDLEKDIAEKKLSIDQAMLRFARESVRESERSIRVQNDFNQKMLATGDMASKIAILQGIAQIGFQGAQVITNIRGIR